MYKLLLTCVLVLITTLSYGQIPATFVVDGVSYTTLNAAWLAAALQATNTHRNQTIVLPVGNFPVTATLVEPSGGNCINIIGMPGVSTGANILTPASVITVPTSLSGDVIQLGNTNQVEGCVFRDFTISAQTNATHGLELQWFRGLLVDNVTVNDTTAEGILLGESSGTHQSIGLIRSTNVSYSSATFTPANRPAYGLHLQKTMIDSYLNTIIVRNALTASIWNEGTGNKGLLIHGFGFPYTCTTPPCSNSASTSSAASASYATSYIIQDTGGAGSSWTDTYADSPSVSAFNITSNGTEIHGGHVQWPDYTSFPLANFATVASSVTNNLLISDFDCLGMSSSVNWINYGSSGGVPPTFASVHHLTGCGNYYQSLEPATTTGFSGGGASNNAPSTGQVATVWASPKSSSGANYEAFSAQLYNGYTTDAYEAHISGQSPFFNVTYQGTIRTTGGLILGTVLNTAATLQLTTANKNVIANATSASQVITLPSCFTAMADKQTPYGMELTIIKSDSSANTVTIQTLSSQNISYGGAVTTSLVISSAGKRTLVCASDNTWYAN